MGEGEADGVGQTMAGPLGQRHLRCVVIGMQRIRHGVDVRIVRKLAIERP